MLNVLLLTSTITPVAGIPDLVRTDTDQRLQDYAAALKFYLGLVGSCIDAIIFVENSHSDLTPLRAIAEERGLTDHVEFISIDDTDFPPEYGKGYGEFKMVEYVMRNSRVVGGMKPDDRIWKITGRYRITNLRRIIARAPASYDIYCDLKNHPVKWMDLRLISWTHEGYRAVLHDIYPHLRVDVIKGPAEFYMQGAVRDALHHVNIAPRYTVEPFIDGIRGLTNRNYTRGGGRCKYYLKSVSRRMTPWLWI